MSRRIRWEGGGGWKGRGSVSLCVGGVFLYNDFLSV